jgi:DNA polymerase III epsilon subunit family exonuclease
VRDLESERDTLEAVLAAASAGVLVVAGDGRVSLANPAAHALLDPGGPSLLGRNLAEVVREADWTRLRDALREAGGVPRLTTVEGGSGGTLQAVVTPLAQTTDQAFVLTLYEVSRPPEGGREDRPAAAGRHCASAHDRDRRLAELDCVVLDGETTGFDRDGRDRIVSLAAVRVRRGVVRRQEVFDALVNPGRAIPPSSAAYHGVTDAMVAKAPPLDVVLPAFLRFADGAVLAGHEVWFDLHFLSRESRRLGLAPVGTTQPVLDTALLARLVEPQLADHGLDGLAHRLGVTIENRHSALGDALATAEIYVRLVALLASRGVVTLGQVLEASAGLQDTATPERPAP